ncbi:RNA recognition motif domain-containing protein [Ditylenchus destructor]|nr:RNA recognition motif domain-containing protein [Ditylenchus destructor]
MDSQSILRMISRSRLLICLRNISISRHHMCALRSTQFSVQIPNISLIHQETKLRRFSSFGEPSSEFPSKKSNRDPSNTIRTYSEDIFSPKKHYDYNRTIFVGGLSKFTTVQSLYEHFLQYGTITGCTLAREKTTEISKRYGFVEFESVGQAESTCKFHPHVIDDQEVNVRLGSRKELQQKFKLFVGGLSKETSVETLREYFSKFGQIVECAILRNVDNSSRGFGYVAFKSQESVNNAINLAPHYIDNKEVGLRLAETRQREFTIIVQNLSPNTTDESLHEFYSRFGRLTQCNVKLDPKTGQSRGFGYVAFSSQEEILRALSDRPHIINGKVVNTHQKDQEFIVYVGNLPSDATDDLLFKTFSKYGKIVHWYVKRDQKTNRSLGYGFVSFEKAEEAVQAIKGGPYKMNGRTLRMDPNKTISLSKKSFK